MSELAEYGNVMFASILENELNSAGIKAEEMYKAKYNRESGTIFLIDMDTRVIYIYSDGEMLSKVAPGRAVSRVDGGVDGVAAFRTYHFGE